MVCAVLPTDSRDVFDRCRLDGGYDIACLPQPFPFPTVLVYFLFPRTVAAEGVDREGKGGCRTAQDRV